MRKPQERAHYPAILAWVYGNRFAIASQIQRRFAKYLKSGRTARRHLQELESLGWLGVAPARAVGPLFPKVYYVTRSGVERIKGAFRRQGKAWEPFRVDRKGWHSKAGFSAEHVIHELLLTEFLLGVWREFADRSDWKLLQMERRSLGRNPAFALPELGKLARLHPDAMFVVQNAEGVIVFLVELDLGTMSRKQLGRKFRRYAGWLESGRGARLVRSIGGGSGCKEGSNALCVVWIVKNRVEGEDRRRVAEVVRAALPWFDTLDENLWCTTMSDLAKASCSGSLMGARIWTRCSDAHLELAAWDGRAELQRPTSSEVIWSLEALCNGMLVPAT
jgi:hypothetical protein